METLLLNSADVETYAPTMEVVEAVRQAFAAEARGDVVMPSKSYVDLPQYNGDFRSMPAYLDAGSWDAAGVKWVNVHPDNPANHGMPTVMGTMIYSDPANAFPLAIMDGTEITVKRTGAAAAVATDYLAIPDATSLGLIGAGVQAYSQLEAIATVRDIQTVIVADKDEDRVADFVDAFADRFDVRGGSVADAAACDVLSTVTPVREPIVSAAVVGEHTHVNAIGADAPGKHELADELLLGATIVIDNYEQCTHSGEINVPFSEGLLGDEDIDATLGELVVGESRGRTDAEGVTVFDSTGLAIQDVAAAHVVYEHAETDDGGHRFDLLGLGNGGSGGS